MLRLAVALVAFGPLSGWASSLRGSERLSDEIHATLDSTIKDTEEDLVAHKASLASHRSLCKTETMTLSNAIKKYATKAEEAALEVEKAKGLIAQNEQTIEGTKSAIESTKQAIKSTKDSIQDKKEEERTQSQIGQELTTLDESVREVLTPTEGGMTRSIVKLTKLNEKLIQKLVEESQTIRSEARKLRQNFEIELDGLKFELSDHDAALREETASLDTHTGDKIKADTAYHRYDNKKRLSQEEMQNIQRECVSEERAFITHIQSLENSLKMLVWVETKFGEVPSLFVQVGSSSLLGRRRQGAGKRGNTDPVVEALDVLRHAAVAHGSGSDGNGVLSRATTQLLQLQSGQGRNGTEDAVKVLQGLLDKVNQELRSTSQEKLSCLKDLNVLKQKMEQMKVVLNRKYALKAKAEAHKKETSNQEEEDVADFKDDQETLTLSVNVKVGGIENIKVQLEHETNRLRAIEDILGYVKGYNVADGQNNMKATIVGQFEQLSDESRLEKRKLAALLEELTDANDELSAKLKLVRKKREIDQASAEDSILDDKTQIEELMVDTAALQAQKDSLQKSIDLKEASCNDWVSPKEELASKKKEAAALETALDILTRAVNETM